MAFSSGKMREMEVHEESDLLLLPRIKVERKEMDKSSFQHILFEPKRCGRVCLGVVVLGVMVCICLGNLHARRFRV